MANKFIGGEEQVRHAWKLVGGEARDIERRQIAKLRPAIELETLPLIEYFDEDPESLTYKQTKQRSGGVWIVSTSEGTGRAGVACRAPLKVAALKIVEGTHVLADEAQILDSLAQEKSRAAAVAAEDLRNTQGRRPVIVSLPKGA